MGAEVVIEMDADFSHQPAHVPLLLARLEGDRAAPRAGARARARARAAREIGLVLGSRAVSGGRDANRGSPAG
jgi:hypothetical protein